MAEVIPFRAWRYSKKAGTIDKLFSPLPDMMSKEQQKELYKNPLNSIHLTSPGEGYFTDVIVNLLATWKNEGYLAQDTLPAFYIYYQYYQLPGTEQLYCRKGFICNIRIHSWEDKVILRHEAVIPSLIEDRIDLLEKAEMHFTPTHGLYTDSYRTLEKYMDESIFSPLYDITDVFGVQHKLAVIQDASIIKVFQQVLKEKTIILADGHHRYTASLLYKQKQIECGDVNNEEGFNFHCMYLTNTEENSHHMLATHRLVYGLNNFNELRFVESLKKYFEVSECTEEELKMITEAKEYWTFGIVLKDKYLKINLIDSFGVEIDWNFPELIKGLDLTVMHYFILNKVLGIKEKAQKNAKNIDFSFNFTKCVDEVKNGEAQVAIITRNILMEEVKKVCYSGYTFPQKATYFYPKVASGLVFSSISEKEFKNGIDVCLSKK